MAAMLFAGVAGKYVGPDGTVFCGGSTWNDPKASALYAQTQIGNLQPEDNIEKCTMLPLFDYDPLLQTARTTWYEDRSLFGEANSRRVAAWEGQNLVCDDERTENLILPKKEGKLVWNHIGGRDGKQWGKCQEWDITNSCRGNCPVSGDGRETECDVKCEKDSTQPGCRQTGDTANLYCEVKPAACVDDRQYIQIDEVGSVNGEPLSFKVTNLNSDIGKEGSYNPDGKVIQTRNGEMQTMMQGAALQINVAPDSAAKFKYEFVLTNTGEQPARAIWPICFTFYVSRFAHSNTPTVPSASSYLPTMAFLSYQPPSPFPGVYHPCRISINGVATLSLEWPARRLP